MKNVIFKVKFFDNILNLEHFVFTIVQKRWKFIVLALLVFFCGCQTNSSFIPVKVDDWFFLGVEL